MRGENDMSEQDQIMKTLMPYFQTEKDNKLRSFRQRNRYVKPGQILFTGSSLMEQFPICEFCATEGLPLVYNRGIGGYTTDEFLEAIDVMLLDLKPSKVFINIGTNDIRAMENGEDWFVHLSKNYRRILEIARRELPDAIIYMMAYYPVNRNHPRARQNPAIATRTNENVNRANRMVEALAAEFGCRYIDVNDGIKDAEGNLLLDHTVDGVHMDPEAYRAVFERLRPYI